MRVRKTDIIVRHYINTTCIIQRVFVCNIERVIPLRPDMVVYNGVMNRVVLSTGLPYQTIYSGGVKRFTRQAHILEIAGSTPVTASTTLHSPIVGKESG